MVLDLSQHYIDANRERIVICELQVFLPSVEVNFVFLSLLEALFFIKSQRKVYLVMFNCTPIGFITAFKTRIQSHYTPETKEQFKF